jgi:hypothetical protein
VIRLENKAKQRYYYYYYEIIYIRDLVKIEFIFFFLIEAVSKERKISRIKRNFLIYIYIPCTLKIRKKSFTSVLISSVLICIKTTS